MTESVEKSFKLSFCSKCSSWPEECSFENQCQKNWGEFPNNSCPDVENVQTIKTVKKTYQNGPLETQNLVLKTVQINFSGRSTIFGPYSGND